MERISAGLKALGHEVTLDLEEKIAPHSYDIVHLYNFATPEVTQRQAKRAVEANIPFIVTTMYEDWPFFFGPMVETFLPLEKYIQTGQQPGTWQHIWETRDRIPPSDRQDNSYAAFHAAALVGTGKIETDAIRRDYPEAKLITDYRCGCEVSNSSPNPELFRKFSGVDDFVLCVGRLEWRKNQLMLLKALEDSDLTLVMATGGFTYQADYEALCRAFKRKGKTLFLPKIEPELLASAFAASKVHVLPSFFELPGLVSLEAAKYGTNVVVSDYGTIRDYLGEDGIYCQPDSPESILKAVTEGWNRPRNDKLQKRMEPFTWQAATERYLEIYSRIVDKQGKEREAISMKQTDHGDLGRLDVALQTIAGASAEVGRAKETVSLIPQRVGGSLERIEKNEEAEKLCNEGDKFTRDGMLLEAANRFKLASQVDPTCARAFRGLGVVAMNQGQLADSEGYFRRALLVDVNDIKSDIGIAAVQSQTGRKKDASLRLLSVLEKEPINLIALKQYLQLAYELSDFGHLERVLHNYLEIDKDNLDITFCLAGCLYKQKRLDDALNVLDKILAQKPNHESAVELKDHMLKETVKHTGSTGELHKEASAKPMTLIQLEELLRKNKFKETIDLAVEIQKSLVEDSEHAILVDIIKAEALICSSQGEQAKAILEAHRDHAVYGYRATATLGVLWGSRNDWEKAAFLFTLSIAIKHDHDVALSGLGIAYLIKGDRETSWEFFSRAHAANPENIRALTGMIELAYPLNRLEALEQALLKYLEYMPANLSILYAHAGCAYALGKKDLAVEQLQKIKIFDENHALANELLAKISEDRFQAAQNRA
jgi:glycosyltransferase involved in cell wall biosynthesis